VRLRYPVGAALVALVAWFLWMRPGRQIFEVPDGYLGPVVVFFAHPKGISSGGSWGAHVYRIPPSGILLLKDGPPEGFQIQEWAHVGPDGKLTAIPSEDEARPDLSIKEPRVRQSLAISNENEHGKYRWVEARIGRPADIDSFGPPPRVLIDSILQGLKQGSPR
jgi:hypothetical protein